MLKSVWITVSLNNQNENVVDLQLKTSTLQIFS